MRETDAQARGPIIPIRSLITPPVAMSQGALMLPAAMAFEGEKAVTDARGRGLEDLRISVTDRCNFRCTYCMPRATFGRHHRFLPHEALLSFEEITRVAAASLRLGVRKLRLTGGEPLLRKDIERLIEQLAGLRTLDGQPPELTLTTNGVLLTRKAQALKDRACSGSPSASTRLTPPPSPA